MPEKLISYSPLITVLNDLLVSSFYSGSSKLTSFGKETTAPIFICSLTSYEVGGRMVKPIVEKVVGTLFFSESQEYHIKTYLRT